jgi:pimeloyl-ACP methyl ester carboxylesterase
MVIPRTLVLSAGLTALLASPANSQSVAPGLKTDVVFSEYSELSSTQELVRRLLSPLSALRATQEAARAGKTLRGQPLDLASERFSVYVPPDSGARRYSLLVFVPPWPRAEVPAQWIPALDRHDMILVTAARSGNDASTVDRREPLALLAAHNVMAQYAVDPQRVYVGGFSGGSRVALRLALGYPELFHGVLLNAGSDPIGNADVPLPPAELLRQFQDSMRLVYVTGERDDAHLVDDAHSRQSLEKWCVFDVDAPSEPRVGHEPADASAFARALDALLRHVPARPQRLADCRARLAAQLSTDLQQVEAAFVRGDTAAAKKLLGALDARYGGLAAPRSVELAGQ